MSSYNNYKLHRTQPERVFPLLTDAYKITHYNQYHPGTQHIYSYMEPRINAEFNEIVWCGLQFILKHYNFINTYIDRDFVNESRIVCSEVFGDSKFNVEGWNYIVKNHGGNLPLNIWALPEGTIISPGTPVLAIENTDPKVPWLTNYVESILMHCYAMTNTATISYAIYNTIKKYCDLAGDTVSPFHLNDFGLRGASSLESAELCGIGHLLIFLGTDNLPAIDKARWYYNSDVCGYSVIAAEHSTITSWGKDCELDAYKHILTNVAKPNDTVSLVIDSYDWRHVLNQYFCNDLSDIILNRPGKTVLRPDSGDPVKVSLEVLQTLWDRYGGIINSKGYKVLDPHLGMIYGDGININSIDEILKTITDAKFSPSNIIFGCGGNLLQNHNRDTLRFAIKCSEITINNTKIPIQKTTIGKESKSGRFNLPLVYSNGKLLIDEDLSTIRKRIGILI